MEIRKIQKLGTTSLIVTLPKTWVNRLGIKPGDSVYLVERENELRIIPFKGDEEVAVTLRGSRERLDGVMRLLRCAMQMGFSKIKLKFDSPISKEEEELMNSIVLEDRDYEGKLSDPFTFEVDLVNKLSFSDIGAMIRESMSLFEKSLSIITNSIESLNPNCVVELEKIQRLFEQRKLNKKHISMIIERNRGDLVEERRVCSFASASYGICLAINSTNSSFLEIFKVYGPEGVVSKDDAGIVKDVVGDLMNVIWETIGALTNESNRRAQTAKDELLELKKKFETTFRENKVKNDAVKGVLTILFMTIIYFEMLLNDINCYIESKSLEGLHVQ